LLLLHRQPDHCAAGVAASNICDGPLFVSDNRCGVDFYLKTSVGDKVGVRRNMRGPLCVALHRRITGRRRERRVNVNLEAQWSLLTAHALLSRVARGRKQKEVKDGKSKSLELHLTGNGILETLINAVHKTSDGGFAELEFRLRAAWRSGLPQSDYRSVTPDVG
jgi:hypothetical protein